MPIPSLNDVSHSTQGNILEVNYSASRQRSEHSLSMATLSGASSRHTNILPHNIHMQERHEERTKVHDSHPPDTVFPVQTQQHHLCRFPFLKWSRPEMHTSAPRWPMPTGEQRLRACFHRALDLLHQRLHLSPY